jgi:hypothetical protein
MSNAPRDERARHAERPSLHRDVLAGFEQLARGEGREHDAVSIRELIDEIKARGRAALLDNPE